MASKTGILSDDFYNQNCLEYQALPIGQANANYARQTYNPIMTGVKGLRYQQSASKPVSADVLAVNMSSKFPGNKAQNARDMLDGFQRHSKAFRPIAVETLTPHNMISRLERGLIEARANAGNVIGSAHYDHQRTQSIQATGQFGSSALEGQASIMPRISGPSRGDQILKASIGVQAGNQLLDDVRAWFRGLPSKADQNLHALELYHNLTNNNMTPEYFMPLKMRDIDMLELELRPPVDMDGDVIENPVVREDQGWAKHRHAHDERDSLLRTIREGRADIRLDMFMRMVEMGQNLGLPGFNPYLYITPLPVMERTPSGLYAPPSSVGSSTQTQALSARAPSFVPTVALTASSGGQTAGGGGATQALVPEVSRT